MSQNETSPSTPLKDGVNISHKEGDKRGIASNHSDPEHLWKGLGLDYAMDGFRKDVKKAMTGTQQEPKNTEVLAREVIRGLWGNGSERKRRLTEDGYNYREVQDRVNEILR